MLCPVEDTTDVQAWQITTAPGGWLRFNRRRLVEGEFADTAKPQPVIYLRVAKDAEGKPSVREAVMIGGEPINAASWRDVPFDTARMFASGIGDESAPPVFAAIADQLGGTDALSLESSLEALFANSAPPSTLVDRGTVPSGSLSMLRPPTDGITDDFLVQLSAAYRELVAAKRAPAPAIAEQTGRPVGTVHRWIAEARRREFLPPALRGKAG